MNNSNLATGHFVQIFENQNDHTNTVADRVSERIQAGSTCIVVATPEHRAGISARLQSLGVNLSEAIGRYQYIELDARTLLSSFMDGPHCDRSRFHQMFDTLVRQAGSRGEPIFAVGEMVNLLVEDGLTEAALELEELWNELSRQHHFTLFCCYCSHAVSRSAEPVRTIERILAVHSHVPGN